MPTTTTTLTEVEAKPGQSKKTGKPYVLTLFKAADGRQYQTFDGNLASRASSLLHQTVELEYEEKLNGQFTNYEIQGVQPSTSAAQPTGVVLPPVQEYTAAPANKADQFRTKEQIMRTDALNATLTLFGIIGLDPLSGVEEFEGWYGSLYKLIEQGVFETPDVRVGA